ncbi:hypothetical protein CC78DRAFT_571912 [Lojkania enalia]|uniref:Uncharacterized protein n=1 Tax=Lojkania enalia TaxID=147567 RepID=A0A9P4JZX4_9PLEO|nr:hypothetical protein CC78DRAFT_571912 [Didymosphaeria enalia]
MAALGISPDDSAGKNAVTDDILEILKHMKPYSPRFLHHLYSFRSDLEEHYIQGACWRPKVPLSEEEQHLWDLSTDLNFRTVVICIEIIKNDLDGPKAALDGMPPFNIAGYSGCFQTQDVNFASQHATAEKLDAVLGKCPTSGIFDTYTHLDIRRAAQNLAPVVKAIELLLVFGTDHSSLAPKVGQF